MLGGYFILPHPVYILLGNHWGHDIFTGGAWIVSLATPNTPLPEL